MDCYCDASYNKEIGVTVVGFKIGHDEIRIEELINTKNTKAELVAVDRCISVRDELYPGAHLTIHTDCQRACQNEYPNVTMSKIKGHKKKALRDAKDEVFRTVDRAVRRRLRKLMNGADAADESEDNDEEEEVNCVDIKDTHIRPSSLPLNRFIIPSNYSSSSSSSSSNIDSSAIGEIALGSAACSGRLFANGEEVMESGSFVLPQHNSYWSRLTTGGPVEFPEFRPSAQTDQKMQPNVRPTSMLDCYCDASYNKEIGVSVIGFKIGHDEIRIEELINTKNTQAELVAVDRCISVRDELYPGAHLTIHTDCQRACQNEYPNVTMSKIKGHKKKALRDAKDEVFRTVDRAVRRRLRKLMNGADAADESEDNEEEEE